MLDLNLIYTFLEVSRMGNLKQAAQKLFVSSPALSQRIRALEEYIGKSLFLRRRTGMELNPNGKQLLEICSHLEGDLSRIANWILAQKGIVGGELRIATISTFPDYIFPKFFKKFLMKYPKISIKVMNHLTHICEEKVLSGEADVGIIAGKCQRPSLKMKRLIENNNVLMVCVPDYFLAKKKYITRKDLETAQIIWHGDPHSRTLRLICQKWDIPFHVRANALLLPSMEACKQHALQGIGVAFIVKMCIYDELKNGKLVAIPGLNMMRPAYLISRNEKYEIPSVTRFKEEFVPYCHELDKKWSR